MGEDCECDDEDDRSDDPSVGSDVHIVSLSLDEILSTLAHHQRRDLVRFFVEHSSPTATAEECVEHLAKQEEKRSGEAPDHDEIESRLHHVHVPKLADAGIVEYDPRSKEIRYWSQDDLERWLDRIDEVESKPD